MKASSEAWVAANLWMVGGVVADTKWMVIVGTVFMALGVLFTFTERKCS
jgi:Zn-dependent membrane protease YugP